MSKVCRLSLLSLTLLLALTPIALIGDHAYSPNTDGRPLIKSPGSPPETPIKIINKTNLKGLRGILWYQLPDTTSANGYACQLDTAYPFDADLVEDVTPGGSGWIIDSVTTWFHNWNGFNDWSYVSEIHFMVYHDSTPVSPHPVDSPFIHLIIPQSNYTATVLPTDSSIWKVDIDLPTSVNLAGGERYWIEIQPLNLLSQNGQTGLQGAAGIGNGQEVFFRGSIFGYPQWVPADSVWGLALETALILRGELLPDTIRWDFETGWQGWSHSNALSFPGGWDVQPSDLHPTYTPPNAGDSTFWIDSDAFGSGAGWIRDTAFSPQVIPDDVTTNWLWYGFGYNDVALGDFFEVGIRYFDGMSWTVVPLRTYTGDTTGADSIDISAYNIQERLQVYFYYDDADSWAWYAAFDNVTVNGVILLEEHDVGAVAIDEPGNHLLPGEVFTPTATYHNFGSNTETFDAYFMIDSAGLPVYSEMVTIADLDPGEDTTHSFPSHSLGGDGFTYNNIVYTVLAGDANPLNDTLSSPTLVSSRYWEVLAGLPGVSTAHSMATLDDGFIYILHYPAYSGDTVYKYDIAGQIWSVDTTNPFGGAGYGYAAGVNGKIYRIGGTDSWPTALNRVDIYDPVARTWMTGATAPSGLIDFSGGVYNDSLIYTFGGGNWSTSTINNVYIYDTYADSWTSATGLPQKRGTSGGGIIDTFAIVACGFDTTAAPYFDDYMVGIIDASNPTTINWGTPIAIPGISEGKYRVPSGVDRWNKEFYIVGGQGNSGTHDQTMSYSPYTDTWVEEYPKTFAFANVQPLVATEDTRGGEVSIYAAGGYATTGYLSELEQYHTGDTLPSGLTEDIAEDFKFGIMAVDQLSQPGYAAITYSTGRNSTTTLKVYDLMGRNVRTLVNRAKEAPGRRTAYWNYNNNNDNRVTNGVYFLRLESDNKVATRKMVIVR